MNRKKGQRTGAGRTLGEQNLCEGDERIIRLSPTMQQKALITALARSSTAMKGEVINTAALLLREARPTKALRCVMKATPSGEEFHLAPCEANYDWLAFVVSEGFDPNGPHGPTYWRIAETDQCRYYSVFRRRDTAELVLLISEPEMAEPLGRQ